MHPEDLQKMDDAVSDVFLLMLDLPCRLFEEDELAVTADLPSLCVSVQFSGPLVGSCTLHVDHATARALTCCLTGEMPVDGTLSNDTVGELCNMIAGSWKSRLPAALSVSALSAPSAKAPYLSAAGSSGDTLRRTYAATPPPGGCGTARAHTLILDLTLETTGLAAAG